MPWTKPTYRRLSIFLNVLLSILMTATPALAWVLPDTGQTKCYSTAGAEIACAGTGQDGAYNGSQPHYNDNRDGTVTDLNTGLMWQQTTDATRRIWSDAGAYCTNLPLDGYGDWRLPTISELLTIASYGKSTPACESILLCPTDINLRYFWTITSYNDSGLSSAEAVNFDSGHEGTVAKTSSASVRCVRGGPSPAGSFTDNGDGTITESTTGLIWEKVPGASTYTWINALAHCEGLSLAGRTDWRLPDRQELKSLVDPSRSNPSIDPAFNGNCQPYAHWTSTSYYNVPNSAWVVGFGSGNALTHGAGNSNYARCVRGGPAGSPDPLASLSGVPNGTVATTSATITVGGTGITQYRYKLDSGNFSAARSIANRIALAGMSRGAHTLEVLGINNASKLQANPTTATWTIDTGVTSGDGTNTGKDDSGISFPGYCTTTYNATACSELSRLGVASGLFSLAKHTAWELTVNNPTALTYIKSGNSEDIKTGINLLSNANKVDKVLSGLINASSPALPNGYALFTRNTTSLSATYQVDKLRYVKIKGDTIYFIPIKTTAFSTAVTDDAYVYLRDSSGQVVSDSFKGAVTIYAWIKDNGKYDADATPGTVADPGLLGSSSDSSSSSSTGCVMNPDAGMGWEWMLLVGGLLGSWWRTAGRRAYSRGRRTDPESCL